MYKLKEYTKEELPSVNTAIEKGLAFANKIESNWSKSKEFEGVQTYTTWADGQFWAARVSTHSDISYEEMLETVGKDHTENEAEYIGIVDSFKYLNDHDGWLSRQVHYKFPFPLRNRDMIIWLATQETKPGAQFVNVTLPRKFESEYTKAYYVSVEVVTKLENGSVQWIMGTTSDAAGWVPQFIQRPQMPAAVAEDVPQFKKWLQKWRESHNQEAVDTN